MTLEGRSKQRRAAIAILEANTIGLPKYHRYALDMRIEHVRGMIEEPDDELFNRRLDAAWSALFRAWSEHKKGRVG